MGRAIELLTGFATAPSTTQTAITVNTGNSLTVRNGAPESLISLLQLWTDVQSSGVARVRAPRMHDNVQGIRIDTVVGDVAPLLPGGLAERLTPQDVLTVDISGSATAGDLEMIALLLYYENLPGIDANLVRWEEIAPRVVHTLTVENTLALGTSGDYSGEEALNAEFDLLKANTDYALLGYLVDAECLAVRWRGADTGNIGLGGPGDADRRELTRSWFLDLSREFGIPAIPVFNSANADGILIDGAQDENGTDVTVTSILAELG